MSSKEFDRPTLFTADGVLAANLVAARTAAGMTQQVLADASRISRATIAQLETGSSDPRLSTLVELAGALEISPLLLLVGAIEARALVKLWRQSDFFLQLPQALEERMQRLVDSGMSRDRLAAGRLGASALPEDAERSELVGAAVFSAITPGPGTVVGALLGRLIAAERTREDSIEVNEPPRARAAAPHLPPGDAHLAARAAAGLPAVPPRLARLSPPAHEAPAVGPTPPRVVSQNVRISTRPRKTLEVVHTK